jgi:hypothetical protein
MEHILGYILSTWHMAIEIQVPFPGIQVLMDTSQFFHPDSTSLDSSHRSSIQSNELMDV